MIRLFICGVTGAMGKNVIELAESNERFKVVGGLGHHTVNPYDFPVFDSFENVNLSFDVIIDFSNAAIVPSLIEFAIQKNTPVVICTTGLSKDTEIQIIGASQSIPVFKSGNMSLGINLLTKLIQQAASVLGDQFDVEIMEKHHNRKLDAPSGTALMLADAVNKGFPEERTIQLGRDAVGKKDRSIINIHAIRGGTIVGEHEVMFAGEDEIITFSHGAYSRRVFAKGALDAAHFVSGKSPGLYNMDDLMTDLLSRA